MRRRIGALILLLFGVGAAFGALCASFDPHAVNLDATLQGASAAHWLGTDHLGRDLAARLIVGAQPSMIALCVALSVSVGVGAVAAAAIVFGGGALARLIRFLAQACLATRTLVLALVLAALLGPGPLTVALALAVTAWAPYALTIAALFERLAAEPYWRASEALGVSPLRAAFRHLAPNAAAPIGALAGADAGRAIALVATLGFFGLSADTGRPEWGAMIHEYRAFLFSAPRLPLAPIFATMLLALGFHLLLDPGERPNAHHPWRALKWKADR